MTNFFLRFQYDIQLRNKTEIKKARDKYGLQWFADNYTLSGVFIQNFMGNYQIIDLSDLSVNMKSLQETIQENTIKLVDEFTYENYQHYLNLNKPILCLAIDSVVNWESSINFLRSIEPVAKKYYNKVKIVWIEGAYNFQRMEMLGINHEKLPAMAFFRIDFEYKVVWPKKWPLNATSVDIFINDYLEFSLDQLIDKYEQDVKKQRKQPIYQYFKDIQELNEDNFDEFMNQYHEFNDILILFFNQKHHQDIQSVAIHFNHVAKRFQSLQIIDVKLCIYDLFYNKYPFENINFKFPFVMLYKQNQKIMFNGEIKAEPLMKFVESHSNERFGLPEYPHIQEHLLDQYLRDISENYEQINEDHYFLKADL